MRPSGKNNACSQTENHVKLGKLIRFSKLIKFSKFASLNKTIQLISIQTVMVWQLDIWCPPQLFLEGLHISLLDVFVAIDF